jgi:hypothetical protein
MDRESCAPGLRSCETRRPECRLSAAGVYMCCL